MRVAFIDHSHHLQTRSSDFFKDAFLGGHEVQLWTDEDWRGGPRVDLERLLSERYDLIVVWQVEWAARELSARGQDFVFVPMWDACRELPDRYWRSLAGARIISFCHALHERVSKAGRPSLYVKFYPEPSPFAKDSFDYLRGFFWQRRAVTADHVARLIRGARFQTVHVHAVTDPGAPALPDFRTVDFDGARVTRSSWFDDAEEFRNAVRRHNVFFAPRPFEGIGFSFLEAMAMGMCVVAVNAPTMNEYITHDVSGLLWDLADPRPLDFSRASHLGRRARETVIVGRQRWLADAASVREFTFTPTHRLRPALVEYSRYRDSLPEPLPQRASAYDLRPASEPRGTGSAKSGGLRTRGERRPHRGPHPPVTVVTVTLDCGDELRGTLRNVLSQDYPNLEVLVWDGGSKDGTLDVIRQHEDRIDLWVSEKDRGPYDAMNRAAKMARGQYVLFMNAGDWFIGTDAITRALRFAPADADFVFGHHIYRRVDGLEELHRANDFETTWRRLRSGDLDLQWLSGVPGHQATFTRTALLRETEYDLRFKIAADHELMYRQRSRGAKFFHCDSVLSVYPSGGYSWQNQALCTEEWRQIAELYGPPGAADRFFGGARRTSLFLGDALLLQAEIYELRKSGLFAEAWYRRQYSIPDEEDPIRDYLNHGVARQRNPAPWFDNAFYLSRTPEASAEKINPFLHYVRFGAAEGRACSADAEGLAPHGSAQSGRVRKWVNALVSSSTSGELSSALLRDTRALLTARGTLRTRAWRRVLRVAS